jgi:hypothetical protein
VPFNNNPQDIPNMFLRILTLNYPVFWNVTPHSDGYKPFEGHILSPPSGFSSLQGIAFHAIWNQREEGRKQLFRQSCSLVSSALLSLLFDLQNEVKIFL